MAEPHLLDSDNSDQLKTHGSTQLIANGVAEGFLELSNGVNSEHDQNTEQNEDSTSVNGEIDKTDENLIDLDTPSSDNFNAFLSCRLIERANALRSAAGEHSENKDSGKRSIQDGCGNRPDDQSMQASHTESGYLTESVTSSSTVGHDRLESLSSEGDRTPCDSRDLEDYDKSTHSTAKDSVFLCNNCGAEDFRDKHEKPRTNSTNSSKALDLISALDNLKELDLKELDLGSDVRLKTGPVKLIDLDGIFVKCESGDGFSRPESLSLSRPSQSARRPHSKSDASSVIPAHVHEEDRVDRKRSKSSGFPIPRVKEGVDISDEGLSKSLPHGMITRKGDMIEFVADDLQEMIRRSSPMSKTGNFFCSFFYPCCHLIREPLYS